MPEQKKIDYDGDAAMSPALRDLLQQFPGKEGVEFQFSTLSETEGVAVYPTSGAAIQSEKADITGHVRQVCLYPFNIVYRAALQKEGQKLKVKEFLDTLARWLERQPVKINGTTYQLSSYPVLPSGNRVIKAITRTGAAHLDNAYVDGVEDWLVSMSLRYENEFDR